MITVLLIVHLFVTLALIGVVLIQRSEGGGLGVGTSQGMGGFMSGRGTANLLTRTTAILGTAFFVLSMALALLNRGTTVGNTRSILDVPPPARTAPPPTQPAAPGVPTTPALTPNPAANATPAPAGPAETTPAAPAVTPTPAAPALPDAPPPAAQLPALASPAPAPATPPR